MWSDAGIKLTAQGLCTLPVKGSLVEMHVTMQKNHRHRICNLILNNGRQALPPHICRLFSWTCSAE